jgi:ketosteroid isomerase-like protein
VTTASRRLEAQDRIAIADLVARYADAVNVCDAVAWGATWSEECTWDLGPDVLLRRRDEVVRYWRTAMASFESVMQVVVQGRVHEEGDGAVGRWTLFEVNCRDGSNGLVVGCYQDRYVRCDSAWLFAERRFTATYRGGLPDGTFSAFPSLEGTDL